ncbi:YIP1 family protein [Rossellomorea aquimaris]|nr:YIP1 family protein [Rossellomorea aquimaris]WRP06594.1 YIP1 family protein [Rossellomorea aquimaris]
MSNNTQVETLKKSIPFIAIPLVNVLFSPKAFFENKKGNFKKRYDFIFIILLNFIVTYFISNQLLKSEALMNNLKDFEFSESLIRVIKIIVTFGSVIPLLFSVVFTSIVLLIALKISKIKLNFEKTFYIIFLAQLPLIISKLTLLIPGVAQDGINTLRITGFGYAFQNISDNLFLITFFNEIDLFVIWSYFLIGLGISILGNVSIKRAAIVSGSLWLLSAVVLSTIKLIY